MQRMEQEMMQRQREADAQQQLAAEGRRIKEDSASAEADKRRLKRAADIERWPSHLCAEAQAWEFNAGNGHCSMVLSVTLLPVRRLVRALSSSKLAQSPILVPTIARTGQGGTR